MPSNEQTRDPVRILLIDDDRPTRTFLADNLCADGFEPLEADSLAGAARVLTAQAVELAIVDLGLPDGDGLRLVEEIRAGHSAPRVDPQLPLMVLSGRTGELDRLRGFARGADDFIPKPFSYQELLARIGALLRRSRGVPASPRLRVGPLELNAVSREVWLRGEPVSLSGKEFALLFALAGAPTRVFTREELLEQVWGYQAQGATRTLDTHASRVRGKLSALGGRFVINVWGVGYRLMDVELR